MRWRARVTACRSAQGDAPRCASFHSATSSAAPAATARSTIDNTRPVPHAGMPPCGPASSAVTAMPDVTTSAAARTISRIGMSLLTSITAIRSWRCAQRNSIRARTPPAINIDNDDREVPVPSVRGAVETSASRKASHEMRRAAARGACALCPTGIRSLFQLDARWPFYFEPSSKHPKPHVYPRCRPVESCQSVPGTGTRSRARRTRARCWPTCVRSRRRSRPISESLLAQQEAIERSGFLADATQPAEPPARATLAGQEIGAYTLISPIGHGGMGTVWLARRSDGRFEGFAAVKLLNASLVGREGEDRFRREGTILARLTHPSIARLIDAGVSPIGQPYLVLEYVRGQHIDRYCDERALDVPARIRLFLDVLTAVAHAHANLVVHRDIKPSNVLVPTDARRAGSRSAPRAGRPRQAAGFRDREAARTGARRERTTRSRGDRHARQRLGAHARICRARAVDRPRGDDRDRRLFTRRAALSALERASSGGPRHCSLPPN